MNKATIKNFAVEARKKLIASVKDKAGRIGIAKENITAAIRKGEGYAVFPTHIGIETTLVGKELKQRENLVNRIQEKGYESVMEEVAYTWFNRIIAVRFMEVNDYLPSRIRVLSSETKGKFEPDIVTQAPKIDLQLTLQEIEEIISLKEKNELDKLFRLLFIKQCNELGEILPELFENTSKYNKDYTEILLDISYTNEDGVVRDLLKIDEEDFLEAVEIIGWMYQYYNTEPKDETFALLKQNVKITKERIPAATQLFTPDWIVRYMVENSLGRFWLEGHPNVSLKTYWKYYLDEAEQEPDVIKQLETIRAKYTDINPEEIKVIDPCMGSGHILVYAFELLMQIYESCGYTQRDAAGLIVENNLYGLDIDDRAYQLAYFAIMMKGRKYDRRFLTKRITPNLCSVQESNSLISFEQGAGHLKLDSSHRETANYLITAFKDAKEYGSILNIEERDYDGLLEYIEELQKNGVADLFISMWLSTISAIMLALIRQAKFMAQKYDVVMTNPPYMGSGGMGANLSNFVKENYPDSKSDLFACFIERGLSLSKSKGYCSMITMQSWMFLSSYESLRKKILVRTISSLVQIGYNSFPEINSKVAQAVAFSVCNCNVSDYKGTYLDLTNKYPQAFDKKEAFHMELNKGRYTINSKYFSKIPGIPIAYWVSDKVYNIYSLPSISRYMECRSGIMTGNDNYIKMWAELNVTDIKFDCNTSDDMGDYKWFPLNSGGVFKKYYGNNTYVVDLWHEGENIKNNVKNFRLRNKNYYFQKGITWGRITSSKIAFRVAIKGSLFGDAGPIGFIDKNRYYVLGFLCSNVALYLLEATNPTLNYQVGDIESLPLIIDADKKSAVEKKVLENIEIAKKDWDSFEISWDFSRHPLLKFQTETLRIKDAFNSWTEFAQRQFEKMKTNEEALNNSFVEIYGLQNVLTSEIENKDVSIRKANLQRDIRSFISYSVGCMFGRYSLNVEGLTYAGGEWDDNKYTTFTPDKDNIISITDEEYFDDDIVSRFVRFVKVIYGEETLEENLDFIAEAIGNKGSTSREAIRNYFLKEFYKDHVKTYQKRPIYWLFDSGKENGFIALIYLHRYDENTIGRVRADYLHKTQAAIENAIASCDVVLESNAPASDKAKAVKQKGKLVKQLAETRIYDQAIAHIAHQRISLDLDDGVLANYAKFQGIEVSSEGKKSLKVDLIGKI